MALASACGESRPSYPERTPPQGFLQEVKNQQAGETLFKQHCTECHGKPSEGRSPRADFFEPPAPDFYAARYAKIDPAYLFWRITHGKTVEPYLSKGSVMPSFGPYLSEEQIWQLVSYLRVRGGISNG